MVIRPEDLIEAFQESEEFPFGARTIDFYQRLGFSENDIRELLKTNKKVLYGRENYIIGLTRKIATNIVKNIKSNRRY